MKSASNEASTRDAIARPPACPPWCTYEHDVTTDYSVIRETGELVRFHEASVAGGFFGVGSEEVRHHDGSLTVSEPYLYNADCDHFTLDEARAMRDRLDEAIKCLEEIAHA